MAGYANRNRRSDGVLHPIQVSTLALAVGESAPVLVVTFDLVGIPTAQIARICAAINEATGVDPQRILIACSHTHFAPSMGPQRLTDPSLGIQDADDAYVAEVVRRTVEACAGALSSLRPGRAEILRTNVPHVHFNRRLRHSDGSVETQFLYPEHGAPSRPRAGVAAGEVPAQEEIELAPTDDELVAIRCFGENDTTPGALLINFACHPVTGDEAGARQSMLISSDYVHYLRQALAIEYGCPVCFTLGAAGDVVPLRRLGHSRRWIGESLAAAILLGDRAFRRLEIDTLTVQWDESTESLRSTHQVDGGPEQAERAFAQAVRSLQGLRSGEPADHRGAAASGSADTAEVARAAADYERTMATAYAARAWPDGRAQVRLQSLRLGPISMVAFPFEVLAATALRLKAAHPGALLLSCANGYGGYLPTQTDYPAGGYEASPRAAFLAPGSAERLVALAIRAIEAASGFMPAPRAARRAAAPRR